MVLYQTMLIHLYTTDLYNFLSFVTLDYYPVMSIFSHILIGSLVKVTLTSSSSHKLQLTFADSFVSFCSDMPKILITCSGQKILNIVLQNHISVVSVRLIICEELSCILWLIGR